MSQKLIIEGFTRRVKREEKVQLAVCKYLKTKYPDIIFMCDLSSGMKLPIHIAAMNKRMRSSRGLPDLFIAFPRGGFSGLFLELKGPKVTVFNKDGSLRKDVHLQEQYDVILGLRKIGYRAEFAVGFKQTVDIIEQYMGS